MGEAFLDYKKGGSGLNINGIIKDYYAAAGEKVEVGDFVEFVNGIAGKTTETSEDTAILEVTYRSYRFSACKLSEDKVFIAHSTYNNTSKSNYLYGIVCTISGTTITVGADTLLSSEERAGNKSSVVTLSETSVFIAHNGTSSYCLYGMICSISGTAITVETTKKLNSTLNTGSYISAKLMQNGNVFVAHSFDSYAYLYGMIVVVNGTTITNGSSTQLNAGMYSAHEMSLLEYDNEMAIIHTGNSSYYLNMTLCLVDGFTITLETATQIGKEQYSGACISAQKLENGNIFVAHSYSSNYYLYGLVIDVSNGGSIGTDTELLTLNNSAGESAGNPSVATILLSNNRILISCNASTLYGMIANISGTTITIGENVILDSDSDSGNNVKVILPMESDNVLIIHREGSSYYLHAQVFGIDEANNIPTTSVSIPSYETQVRPATSLPCNGVASTSGEGGDSSGHKYIVSVYVREKVPVLKTGDIIPKAWTSVILGTEYQAEGITLKASSYYTSTSYQYLSYACDNSETSFWMARANNGNDWVMWIFPEATKITKMKLKFDSSTGGSIIAYIQGSNNESDWTNLHTVTSARTSLTEISLDNTDYYTHYKILFETTGTPCLYDWQVSEYEVLE